MDANLIALIVLALIALTILVDVLKNKSSRPKYDAVPQEKHADTSARRLIAGTATSVEQPAEELTSTPLEETSVPMAERPAK